MFTRLIARIVLAAPVFGLLGCASFSTPTTYGLDTSNATLVRQTCSEIMGLRTGPEFEACGGSLAETVRVLQDASLTAEADRSCAQQGLMRGTAEQAKCVVMFRRAADRSASASGDVEVVPEAQPWQSYFSMSHTQQAERTELSCAQLGLHPAGSGFWHCVTDLRSAIANIRPDTMP
jgi:hypothetical protein